MEMKITVKLESGKKVKFTKEEYEELKAFFNEKIYYPYYPYYTTYPYYNSNPYCFSGDTTSDITITSNNTTGEKTSIKS